MLTFIYVARDTSNGRKIKAEIEAENEAGASKMLIARGLVPLQIYIKGEARGFGAFFKRVPNKQKVIFSRQLSTLINAGLPLVQSLTNVQNQTTNKQLKAITAAIINEIEGGSTLADAMAKYPKIFDAVYVNLVAAGEASGTLDVSLERHANQLERDSEIMSKVRGALVYPAIVIVVLLGLVTFMVTTLLPQVQSLYSSLPGATLPWTTRVLLSVSHFFIHFWWLMFIIGGCLAYLFWRWLHTPGGRSVMDHFKLTAWMIGPLYTKLYMARFARTGGTLVASGVPLLKMLSVTAQAVDNVHIGKIINEAAEKVKGGKSLSVSLQKVDYIPDLVANMIATGEESGQLETMMGKLADYYEKEVDNTVKQISTLIEPMMMVLVGVVVLFVVVAVLLPIYSLAGKNLISH